MLNLDRLLGGTTNSTLLSSLGLNFLNLNTTALLPDASCPGGGLLNPSLGLGSTCVGVQVLNGDVANLCVLQNGGCCCSPGEASASLNGTLAGRAGLEMLSLDHSGLFRYLSTPVNLVHASCCFKMPL